MDYITCKMKQTLSFAGYSVHGVYNSNRNQTQTAVLQPQVLQPQVTTMLGNYQGSYKRHVADAFLHTREELINFIIMVT